MGKKYDWSMNDIFKILNQSSEIGTLYYFADKVNGEFVIKSGREDEKLFPKEKTYGFFYINNITHNEFGIDDYDMTFYYFYESKSMDKLSKLGEIKDMLEVLKSKVENLKLLRSNINNDEILKDFNYTGIDGASEKKLIKIDFILTYGSFTNC